MRFEVLDEGRGHRRWEYLLKISSASLEERDFVIGLNAAIAGKPHLEDYSIIKKKGKYYLTDGHKDYAEFVFSKLPDRKVILSVTRMEIDRRRLHNLLESILCNKFTGRESQLHPAKQPDLFQLG